MQRLEEQIKPFEGQADPGSVSPLHSLSRRSGKARQTDPRSARGGAQRADVTRREAKRVSGELWTPARASRAKSALNFHSIRIKTR